MTTMFKSAAAKIAHNTTIPAVIAWTGNSNLQPLQDLITAEKSVLLSLQKLREDLSKASDALRVWGREEGDDLSSVLTASSTVLSHFATALSTYSSYHLTMRDSMKALRTRQETLDELRQRRRRVGGSLETAEKKLNKLAVDRKKVDDQTDIVNKLREEAQFLDKELLREETEMGDYKRKCAKDWMGFKFGGLAECCERGLIVGDMGRQIIESIPEDITQPGQPRAHYNAHAHVDGLVTDTQRTVSQVAFSTKPVARLLPPVPQLADGDPCLKGKLDSQSPSTKPSLRASAKSASSKKGLKKRFSKAEASKDENAAPAPAVSPTPVASPTPPASPTPATSPTSAASPTPVASPTPIEPIPEEPAVDVTPRAANDE